MLFYTNPLETSVLCWFLSFFVDSFHSGLSIAEHLIWPSAFLLILSFYLFFVFFNVFFGIIPTTLQPSSHSALFVNVNCTLCHSKESLRILTGKKHRQRKIQRLQKLRIWAFGLLIHQINSLEEIFELKQNRQKHKVVTGKNSVLCDRSTVSSQFYLP